MIFTISYTDPSELLSDDETQYRRHGFLVRLSPPEGLTRDAPVRLSIRLGDREASLQATVLQIVPGVGVAVAFTDASPILELVEHARHSGSTKSTGGAAAQHTFSSSEPTDATSKAPKGPTRAAKIRMARHGDRPDRDTILRDTDRSLQRFILTNPGLGLGEVKQLAGLATTLPQTLKAIAEKREWASRAEIAMAILRNPRTPIPIAIKMIPGVNPGELRALVRSGHLRTPILNAARKKLSQH